MLCIVQRAGLGSRAPVAKGGGGTNFQPPLERVFLRKHAVDLVIYFTDGWGPAPENRPYLPVIWTLTPGGTPPASWGEVLEMA